MVKPCITAQKPNRTAYLILQARERSMISSYLSYQRGTSKILLCLLRTIHEP